MSRRDDQRLADILAAAQAIAAHVSRGGFNDGLIFDAVRVRLRCMVCGSAQGRWQR